MHSENISVESLTNLIKVFEELESGKYQGRAVIDLA